MNIQELIDELSKIEDKSMLVIREYDGWYNPITRLKVTELYTSDNFLNITDYAEDGSITFNGVILDDHRVNTEEEDSLPWLT